MWIRVCRYKNAGVAGYAETFRSVQSDSPTSNWYSYFENNVLVIYHLIERNILYMNTTNNRNDFYKEQLDKTLNGNEKIETAIAALQKEATEEIACSYSHRDPSQNAGAGTADHCCRTSKR